MDHHQPTAKLFSSSLSVSSKIKSPFCHTLSFLALLVTWIALVNLVDQLEPRRFLPRFGFLSSMMRGHGQTEATANGCDLSHGKWVWDENYERLYDENCRFLDPGFRCQRNGRRDLAYLKWRWQPHGCDLPRFNASEFLDRSRNGRIVFAGDSIGRNQWESLLCMLSQAVTNSSSIYEINGNPISKHKGFLTIRFPEHNLTVEYYRAPFLVVIGRPPENSPEDIKSTIRVDEFNWQSKMWVGARVLVFNTGHWWNEDKTIKMGCYFQEGGRVNKTMDVMEAFWRSLKTWKSWVMAQFDPLKCHIFFRSYSPVHYRNGAWNLGGLCDGDREPESNETNMEPDPVHNTHISRVVQELQESYKVNFLNITYLSESRKDAHPSKYREPGTPAGAPQDCSHWCLPGVPDTWNEILYAQLLSRDRRVN